jgi:hypothetical protein
MGGLSLFRGLSLFTIILMGAIFLWFDVRLKKLETVQVMMNCSTTTCPPGLPGPPGVQGPPGACLQGPTGPQSFVDEVHQELLKLSFDDAVKCLDFQKTNWNCFQKKKKEEKIVIF